MKDSMEMLEALLASKAVALHGHDDAYDEEAAIALFCEDFHEV